MAAEVKRSYPSMPTPHWWSLRRKFRTAIPKEVTATYLAAALGMAANSAQTNIMPSLRTTGIIDNDGKPTSRAVSWRDDAKYAEVCEEIRKAVYPQELLDLAPDSSVGRQTIQAWFASHTGLGESGAAKMASFYLMLLEADPEKQQDAPAAAPNGGTRPAPRQAKKSAKAAPLKEQPATKHTPPPAPPAERSGPSLHINVQVHIAADANADQIDAIFASMAKYLKDIK